MRKIFYVDVTMCGGDTLPDDFDLDEFCEVLQGKAPRDVEVVPLTGGAQTARNLDPWLISDSLFHEALGEYCHR